MTDAELEGVAALQRSLASLTQTLEERDDEVIELRKETQRFREENVRLRRKLNDEYGKQAENVLNVAASSQQQTVQLRVPRRRREQSSRRAEF